MVTNTNTVNLMGARLTVGTLELIVRVGNEHDGEVLIQGMGHSSLIELAIDLLNYAKAREVRSGK